MKDFVAIDFETANQHRSSVCSVGMVFVENGTITDSFYSLIKPTPNFYCRWATDIHGICHNDTLTADEFPELWKTISLRIGTMPLVAHNSAFDESCLKAVLAANKLPIHQNRFFCTYRKAKQLFPHLPNHRLNTVSEYLGLHLQNHHHALADAEACAHIALQIF